MASEQNNASCALQPDTQNAIAPNGATPTQKCETIESAVLGIISKSKATKKLLPSCPLSHQENTAEMEHNTQASYLTSHGYGMSKIEGNYT